MRSRPLLLAITIAACGEPVAEPAPLADPPKVEKEKPPGPSTAVVSHGRIVAIGDTHGDRVGAIAALGLAGIVDNDGHWIGGDAVLVCTGDMSDRGPDTKGVWELFWALQDEAKAAGGSAQVLMGNHEVMNVQGDLRYVADEDTAGFGGAEARAASLKADGEFGRWIGSLDAVVKVDDTVFAHGGVAPKWAQLGTDAINQRIRTGMWLGKGGDELLGSDGPLWWRDLVQEPEAQICGELDKSLERLGVKRMVVGHTHQDDAKMHTRCDGKLTVIDVGISVFYGRNPAVWELTGGDAKAIYPSGTVDLEDPK